MPSKEHEALVEKVAKAINGPFHPLPNGSPYTLDQLRDVRWQQINDVERKLCLSGAKAALSTILAALQDPTEGILEAGYAWDEHVSSTETHPRNRGLWRAMLNASPLGEQSE